MYKHILLNTSPTQTPLNQNSKMSRTTSTPLGMRRNVMRLKSKQKETVKSILQLNCLTFVHFTKTYEHVNTLIIGFIPELCVYR